MRLTSSQSFLHAQCPGCARTYMPDTRSNGGDVQATFVVQVLVADHFPFKGTISRTCSGGRGLDTLPFKGTGTHEQTSGSGCEWDLLLPPIHPLPLQARRCRGARPGNPRRPGWEPQSAFFNGGFGGFWGLGPWCTLRTSWKAEFLLVNLLCLSICLVYVCVCLFM